MRELKAQIRLVQDPVTREPKIIVHYDSKSSWENHERDHAKIMERVYEALEKCGFTRGQLSAMRVEAQLELHQIDEETQQQTASNKLREQTQ